MFRLLAVLVLATTPAAAAPDPFVVYHSPAARCDVHPVSAACRAAERRDWSEFLTGKAAQYFPRVTKLRLADLFDGKAVHYGWTFRIIAPTAPPRWQQLAITVGGVAVATSPYDRYEQQGSLVAEATLDRAQLAPGTHQVVAKDGVTTVFAFDLELEGSSAPPPLDPKQLAADAASAAAKPPFTIAALPTKPACTARPSPAGCSQSVTRMWIDLFTDPKLHATTFARKHRPDGTGWHWQVYAVFPTAPASGWLDRDLEIQLDRTPAKYARRYRQVGTEAIVVELVLLETDHAPGTHELRALDRTGKALLTTQVELEK